METLVESKEETQVMMEDLRSMYTSTQAFLKCQDTAGFTDSGRTNIADKLTQLYVHIASSVLSRVYIQQQHMGKATLQLEYKNISTNVSKK